MSGADFECDEKQDETNCLGKQKCDFLGFYKKSTQF
jgi:hypothetical protein